MNESVMITTIRKLVTLQIADREDLEQLSKGCSLGNMINYDDTDKDGRLNINEFYMAFSKLYSKLSNKTNVL